MGEIQFVSVTKLRHIEKFSQKRVDWLLAKIVREGVWTRPLALDSEHNLVLDGQHRMEVARKLQLSCVPAILFDYSAVPITSLRPQYNFDWRDVVARALSGDIYPYKTVKHHFLVPPPPCMIPLDLLESSQ
jgi:hypothetical protein